MNSKERIAEINRKVGRGQRLEIFLYDGIIGTAKTGVEVHGIKRETELVVFSAEDAKDLRTDGARNSIVGYLNTTDNDKLYLTAQWDHKWRTILQSNPAGASVVYGDAIYAYTVLKSEELLGVEEPKVTAKASR